MPHMYDFNRLGINHVVKNLISVSTEHLHTKRRIKRLRRTEWIIRNFIDCVADCAENIIRPGWTMRFQLSVDFFKVL